MSDAVYTHANITFAVSTEPANSDLDEAGFAALTYTPVAAVGSVPERGINTNILSYDTVNTLVSKKAKGITDAGDGTLECARTPSDPGQVLLNTLGQPDCFDSHAFKITKQDGTVEYTRALVAGPTYPGGRNEDFDLATYAMGFQQVPLEVAPEPEP